MIYIPSKKRPHLIKKTLQYVAYCPENKIYLVVAPDEVAAYEDAVGEVQALLHSPIYVITRADGGKGISYARNIAVEHAADQGYEALVMIDDDMGCTNLNLLLDYAQQNSDIGGVAAYWPTYVRFLDLEPNQGVVLHSKTLGQACIGFRTAHVLEVGGFDIRLHRKEDYDMRIMLLKAGYAWYIHTDCLLKLTGKPYGEGGIQSMGISQEKLERDAYEVLCAKHGAQFFSWSQQKTTAIRTHWSKIHKAFGC